MRRLHGLLFFLIACYVVAFVGEQGAFQGLATWYLTLEKPSWSLHPSAFVPVWTFSYGFLALAGWMMWTAQVRSTPALTLYFVLVALSGAWPWLFFSRHLLTASLIAICAAWGAAIAAGSLFVRKQPLVPLVLLPFMIWLFYGAALTITVIRMNSGS